MSKNEFGLEQLVVDSKTTARDSIAFPVEALDINTLQPNDTITGITKFKGLKVLTGTLHDIDPERFGQYPGNIVKTLGNVENDFRAGYNGGVEIDGITYLGVDTLRDLAKDRIIVGHIFGIDITARPLKNTVIHDKSFVFIVGTKPGGKLLIPELYNPELAEFGSTPLTDVFKQYRGQSIARGSNESGGGRRRGNKPQGAQ